MRIIILVTAVSVEGCLLEFLGSFLKICGLVIFSMFCAYVFGFFPLFAFAFRVFQFVGSRTFFHFSKIAFHSDPIFQRLFRS